VRRTTHGPGDAFPGRLSSHLGHSAIGFIVGFALLSARVRAFWERVRQGLTILRDRRRYVIGMLVPQSAGWLLRGARTAFPYAYVGASQVQLQTRPTKAWEITRPYDFDSVAPGYLDGFRFAVAPRSAYRSAAPPNWRLIRQLRSYDVWEREGPTAPRDILAEEGGPGAVEVDDVRAALGGHADVVVDARGAELELDRDLVVGRLADLLDLQRQVVRTQPVRVAGGRALALGKRQRGQRGFRRREVPISASRTGRDGTRRSQPRALCGDRR